MSNIKNIGTLYSMAWKGITFVADSIAANGIFFQKSSMTFLVLTPKMQ